jgi:hypothetical protein
MWSFIRGRQRSVLVAFRPRWIPELKRNLNVKCSFKAYYKVVEGILNLAPGCCYHHRIWARFNCDQRNDWEFAAEVGRGVRSGRQSKSWGLIIRWPLFHKFTVRLLAYLPESQCQSWTMPNVFKKWFSMFPISWRAKPKARLKPKNFGHPFHLIPEMSQEYFVYQMHFCIHPRVFLVEFSLCYAGIPSWSDVMT